MDMHSVPTGDTKPGTANPPVTFCILAFNQESLVEAAMRAAFAQDYDNLEIIVSDDGSVDGTWQRVQAVARAYAGPHRLLVRRSDVNRGVLHHLLDVAELASGRLLVVGAADDLSLPQRTRVMAASWACRRYAAAFADYAVIDEAGRVVEDRYRFDDSWFSPADYLPRVGAMNIHGASSVYDLEQLKKLGRPADDEIVVFEDTWLGLAFTFTGQRIEHVPEVLVQYRRHAQSITNAAKTAAADRQSIERADREWQRRSAAYGVTLAIFKAWYGRQGQRQHLLPDRLDRDIAYFGRVGRWNELSLRSRLATARFASRQWMVKAVGLRVMPMAVRSCLQRFR